MGHTDTEVYMGHKPVVWSEGMETGILWQDLQHKTLIENINGLYNAIIQHTGREHVKRMTDFLESYVMHHFAIEEQYMQTYGDPNREQHVHEHLQFSAAVQDLHHHPEPMGELSAESLYYDLYEWLRRHILHTDRIMADFIKKASTL
jgi:hemerythrin